MVFNLRTPVLFSTWDGVFTSCMLNIFGVVIFLRTGWIVGNAGLHLSLMIVLVTMSIAGVTVLSAIGICHKAEISCSGGVYTLISHVLGGRIATPFSLIYVLSQGIACSLCVLVFSHSIVRLFGCADCLWVERVVSCVTLVVILGVTIMGVRWVVGLHILLLLVLFIAVVNFVVGSFVKTDPANGILGYSRELLSSNSLPAYMAGEDFFTVLGVFVPMSAGVFAGFNMSNDLKNARHNIPVGTMASIAVSAGIYALFAIIMAATCQRKYLIEDPMIAEKISASDVVWLFGLYELSLASAVGNLCGCPIALQAIASDNILSFLKPLAFGKKTSLDRRKLKKVNFFFPKLRSSASKKSSKPPSSSPIPSFKQQQLQHSNQEPHSIQPPIQQPQQSSSSTSCSTPLQPSPLQQQHLTQSTFKQQPPAIKQLLLSPLSLPPPPSSPPTKPPSSPPSSPPTKPPSSSSPPSPSSSSPPSPSSSSPPTKPPPSSPSSPSSPPSPLSPPPSSPSSPPFKPPPASPSSSPSSPPPTKPPPSSPSSPPPSSPPTKPPPSSPSSSSPPPSSPPTQPPPSSPSSSSPFKPPPSSPYLFTLSSHPHHQPSSTHEWTFFVFCNYWASLLGSLACLMSIVMIDWMISFTCVACMALLWLLIGVHNPGAPPGVSKFSYKLWLQQTFGPFFPRSTRVNCQMVVYPSSPKVSVEVSRQTSLQADVSETFWKLHRLKFSKQLNLYTIDTNHLHKLQ